MAVTEVTRRVSRALSGNSTWKIWKERARGVSSDVCSDDFRGTGEYNSEPPHVRPFNSRRAPTHSKLRRQTRTQPSSRTVKFLLPLFPLSQPPHPRPLHQFHATPELLHLHRGPTSLFLFSVPNCSIHLLHAVILSSSTYLPTAHSGCFLILRDKWSNGIRRSYQWTLCQETAG
jgi:hypothetical protein